jgi:hypothetical protein
MASPRTNRDTAPLIETRGRLSRNEIYVRLDEGLAEIRRMGGLPTPLEAEDIWGDIWYQEAHNSTAIEGNTLVLREVAALLAEGRAVGDKQLSEYLEVRGYADAARWVYDQALAPARGRGPLVTLGEVREVHRWAMTPVWEVAPHPHALPEETPGTFRRHNLEPFASGMQPSEWTNIDADISDWVGAVCRGLEANRPPAEVIALHPIHRTSANSHGCLARSSSNSAGGR